MHFSSPTNKEIENLKDAGTITHQGKAHPCSAPHSVGSYKTFKKQGKIAFNT